jgi:hypothetical protein
MTTDIKCLKHKTYKAIRPPRSQCIFCWGMYMEKNPTKVTMKQLKHVLELLLKLTQD